MTTGSPEAVCSISATCFLRRASKNFIPTLTAASARAKTIMKLAITLAGI